ncbi:MAG: chemotaxis-specific protein-glutamate methyltransferase CheB [Proteobacteria bacterium]|nr:chemotaxis-specific protein-glutamate methyltransferase CheB [Pseudomonadota bacterium]NLN63091.1 chemotaxis-specific protein-glutamate methyltransferase CheB [Myxococcales bacterium]
MNELPAIRLLIIDDSRFNRETIADFFRGDHRVEVVGMARDGQQGLHMALTLKPTVITVDLEMPKMDGFAFIRLMMANHPVPIIVISSHAAREVVFRAMELGALDFVAKPSDRITSDISAIRDDVVRKVLSAAHYNREGLRILSDDAPKTGVHALPHTAPLAAESALANRLVVIGASTGGPASLTRILRSLPANFAAAIVIAQHMPPRFTTTFAERLGRMSPLAVTELTASALLRKGHVYLSPGDASIEVHRATRGLLAKAVTPHPDDRYTPSVDRLFVTAAKAAGADVLAVVLTGMGDDGALGVQAVSAKGGQIIAESEETAVIYGMPRAALETQVPLKQRPLHMIADAIHHFSRKA